MKSRLAALRHLYQRDGNTCWICGLFLRPLPNQDLHGKRRRNNFRNWRKSNKSKLATTLDHVIPKSLGGNSSLANLRLAHTLCNQERQCLMEIQEELRSKCRAALLKTGYAGLMVPIERTRKVEAA